jgi:DNA-binding beta-propeller fold protein YncE
MCAPVAIPAPQYVTSIAVDDANVYFTTEQDNDVHGVGKAGGTPPFDIATPSVPPAPAPDGGLTNRPFSRNVALANGTLYWTITFLYGASPTENWSTLASAPVTARGAAATILYEQIGPGNGMTVGPGISLGVTLGQVFAMHDCGNLYSLPLSGGTSWTLRSPDNCADRSPNPSAAIDVADGYAFAFVRTPAVRAVVERISLSDGSTITFPLAGLGAPVDGGPSGFARYVAANAGSVTTSVASSDGTEGLYVSALDGSGARLVASAPPGNGGAFGPMLIDGGFVYSSLGGAVVRVDLATGAVLPLIPGANVVAATMALDTQYLYVVDPGGPDPQRPGAILRVAR